MDAGKRKRLTESTFLVCKKATFLVCSVVCIYYFKCLVMQHLGI